MDNSLCTNEFCNNESILDDNNDIIFYSGITTNMICGYYCSFCIDLEGNVFSFGSNDCNKLGHNNIKIVKTPKQIQSLTNIKTLACGDYHTVCIDFNGKVFTFGRNLNGELGISPKDLKNSTEPIIIEIPPIEQIGCGDYYTICLSFDGYLYSFGNGKYGELGCSHNNCHHKPRKIPNIKDVLFIACGANHVICKLKDDSYYSWGYNHYGQLGLGNTISCNKPIKCEKWLYNFISIKCCGNFSLFLTSSGKIYGCGCNQNGQIGIYTEIIRHYSEPTLIKNIPLIQRIDCGFSHSLCIDFDDNLWVFGNNYHGQLGLLGENKFIPTHHTLLGKVLDISYGGWHTFVKTKDENIYAFGLNEQSQLIENKDGIKHIRKPIQVFKDNKDIWNTPIRKSKAKSARK